MQSNGDASTCHDVSGRKLLFGNEIANSSVGRPRAPRAAMTGSTLDVPEVTAPYGDGTLTISSPVFDVWFPGIEFEAGMRRESRLTSARSFTDRARLVYAKRAASDSVNIGVRQRAFRAREYETAAPFVFNPRDYELAP